MEFKKRDILNALGLETEQNYMSAALVGFGIGCVAGATLAMMFAPKSGRELRSDIVEKGRNLMARGKDELDRATSNLGS